jgi:hypothetical protein
MVLYHFTTPARFGINELSEFDWTADLQPAPSAEWKKILGETPVVWLTVSGASFHVRPAAMIGS